MPVLSILLVSAQAIAQPSTPTAPSSLPVQGAPAAITTNAVCLECHKPIVALLKKKGIHAAVEMGCATCHVDHKAAGTSSHAPHYLNSPEPELCSTCHDTKDKALAAVHHGQPFDRATCTGCHNPHGSDNPKLIAARQHPPFAARQCEKCHQNPQDGKPRFVTASVNELCQTCHTLFKTRYGEFKSKHTLIEIAENSCISCHRPHAGGNPSLLKSDGIGLCTECHEDKPGKKKFVHDPAAANCTICHAPHGSNYSSNLKADVATLCTACHGLQRPTQNSDGEPVVMPTEFIGKANKIELDRQNRGHPTMGHPVAGPGLDRQKDKPMSCVSCHSPHSGDVAQRFVNDLQGTALCLSCHGKR